MPEGDTLFKAAARIRPVLAGHRLTRFEAPRLRGRPPTLGTLIEDVEAHGKNLLVHFAGGLSLRTHLRMAGSWHIYRQGERWQKPAHLARAVVGSDSGWLAVCFQAPVVETYRRGGGEPDALAGLGPDLCRAAPVDAVLAQVLERARRFAGEATTLGEALLDQRIAAGVGNVYKSEACFAARLDPGTPMALVGEADRALVWRLAAEQLQANLGRARRATYGGGLAVYGREGRPCLRCATTIVRTRHGDQARSSYWCPRCQPPPKLREKFHKGR